MKNKWFTMAIGLLLMAGLAGMALSVVNGRGLPGAAASTVTLAQSAQNQPAQSSAAQIAGAYSGVVKLDVTVGGVYSDTLVTPPPPAQGTPAPPDLGSIDLSLQLTQTGSALSGYVSLDKTLVYSVEHTLGAGASSMEIGPYLSGTFDDGKLTLHSEKVALVVGGRTLQRQFRLSGTSTATDGGQVSGEYRETVWGYTSVPVTVIGNFTLQRPGFGNSIPVPSNQAPNVVSDAASTTQDTAVTISVLANDSDADGGVLSVTSVSTPQFGVATTDGKQVTYTPNANFVGTDTFSYVISDGQGGTATGSVAITVNSTENPNQAPSAVDDTTTTTAGDPVTIDVLANDADLDGDALSITIATPPVNGAATVENAQIIYTPNATFVGTDIFTYTITDGRGGSASATVTITVTNQPGGSSSSLYLPLIQR